MTHPTGLPDSVENVAVIDFLIKDKYWKSFLGFAESSEELNHIFLDLIIQIAM